MPGSVMSSTRAVLVIIQLVSAALMLSCGTRPGLVNAGAAVCACTAKAVNHKPKPVAHGRQFNPKRCIAVLISVPTPDAMHKLCQLVN